jgi:hypothetical protein
VELREAGEHGRAGERQGRGEGGARLLGHVCWGRRVEGRRYGVGRGEAFDLPQDDAVFMAGAGEDEVAVEGDAGWKECQKLVEFRGGRELTSRRGCCEFQMMRNGGSESRKARRRARLETREAPTADCQFRLCH